MKLVKVKKKRSLSRRLRKYGFWGILGGVFLLATVFLILKTLKEDDRVGSPKIIRVGIGGAVRKPAVYSLPEGSDMAVLIRRAEGLTPMADILRIDFDKTVLNDSVYCIPRRFSVKTEPQMIAEFEPAQTIPLPKILTDTTQKEIQELNIFYIGSPAVYVIINYIPEIQRLNFIHIPHSTVLLQNDYRLIDVFFTLGIEPTVNMLQSRLGIKIDYYMIQDRFAFIEMIDMLNGLQVNYDPIFAREYSLKPRTRLNGLLTWEYIRFLDLKNIRQDVSSSREIDLITEDNFFVTPADRQNAYEMRQHRQRLVIQAMRESFKEFAKSEQVLLINKLIKTFDTNIGIGIILDLYQDIMNTPNLSYGNLPGYYQGDEKNLYYYPDVSTFKAQRNQLIRENLNQSDPKRQTLY